MDVVALRRIIYECTGKVFDEYRRLTVFENFFRHFYLRRTTEYLVASADTRPYLIILRFRVARSVKVGLESRFLAFL